MSFSDNWDSDKDGRQEKEKLKKLMGGGSLVNWRKTCSALTRARAFLDKRTLSLKMSAVEKISDMLL